MQFYLWRKLGKALFQIGKRQEYTIQALGGSDNSRFMISGAYLDDEGLVKMSKFNRYSVRGKIDGGVSNWLKMGLNMGLTYSNKLLYSRWIFNT